MHPLLWLPSSFADLVSSSRLTYMFYVSTSYVILVFLIVIMECVLISFVCLPLSSSFFFAFSVYSRIIKRCFTAKLMLLDDNETRFLAGKRKQSFSRAWLSSQLKTPAKNRETLSKQEVSPWTLSRDVDAHFFVNTRSQWFHFHRIALECKGLYKLTVTWYGNAIS